ncbi:MAG: alpha-amylase family glycosyl hydrolase [Anaerolineae bacterium]
MTLTLMPVTKSSSFAADGRLISGLPAFRPGYPRGGAHRDLEGRGVATFCLTAPGKDAAWVVGDFNGWNPLATPMQTDGNGFFWATAAVEGRVRYQFVVPQDESGRLVWVADPYAREVVWDRYGPKAVLADDPPYIWQDQDWRRPPLRDLIIYELCVRDFAGEKRDHRDRFGTFAGIHQKLDHIQALGVNAIELMPIGEFPGDSSWGYNPVFYMAPKHLYGRPHELKALIDAAHQRGIAVILDMVFNHAWPDQPYYRMYPPLFGPNGEPLADRNPFFHHHNNGHANGWGGLDWDHASPWTTAYMQDIVRFWLQEYHVDGFRFDWLGGVEYDPARPERDSFDPFIGIAPIARAAREAQPTSYLIGEYWPIHGTNPAKTAARLVHETEIDAVWNGAFHHALEACLFQTWQWERQDMPAALGGFRQQGFTRADQVINYVVSHDERRPEHEIQFWGAHITWCDPTPEPFASRWELALRKARLGLVALMTSPGVPMLYAGQEFGEDSPRTIEFWPLDWQKLKLPQGQEQFAFYRKLIRLRAGHPALRGDGIEYYWDDFPRFKVLRYKRWDGNGDVAVIGLNFDCVTQRVGLGFPHNGPWREALSDTVVQVEGYWRDFDVPPWSALLLVPAT